VNVLVLAGRRGGDDPVARATGTSHKALAPVAGMPMLERVVATLRVALPEARILVAIDRDVDFDTIPVEATPCLTVQGALKLAPPPVLVTTADHPLLTPEMVRHFLSAIPPHADAAVALASRGTVLARYPETRRTWWHFRETDVSGCNLFYLGSERAGGLVAFWRRLEQDRKRPFAMMRHLGWLTLLRFALGRLGLAEAMHRLSVLTGAKTVAVDMPFAEAAIDVDKPDDLALAERLLVQRAAGSGP
jgi:GTP:adenosylcobinamide-phosphate guanylyltransferase